MLITAVITGNIETVKLLIKHGITDLNEKGLYVHKNEHQKSEYIISNIVGIATKKGDFDML